MKAIIQRAHQGGNSPDQHVVFIATTWGAILFSVGREWSNLLFQWVFWANTVTPMSQHYLAGILLLVVDLILFLTGSYIFIRERKTNLCLQMALLIAVLAITIKGNSIGTLLSAYPSLSFNLSHYGISLNMMGIILLTWYLKLT